MRHAENVLAAAKSLKGRRDYGLAFHLGLLAIEEVGKGQLVTLGAPELRGDSEEGAHLGALDDHERKLFWALWLRFGVSPMVLGKHPGTPKEIARMLERAITGARNTARSLHKLRMSAIYVDPDPEASTPKAAVSAAQCKTVLTMAEECLARAKGMRLERLDADTLADLRWFLDRGEGPEAEAKKRIWTKETLAKSAELGIRKWVRWLREREWDEKAKALELAKKELERTQPPDGEAANAPKWRMRVRLESASHTFSSKAVKVWNERNPIAKLRKVDKAPKSFEVEITFNAGMHVSTVGPAGNELAFGTAMALSMGAMGFFWFEQPRFTEKTYDTLEDLENRTRLDLKLSKRLAVEWHRGPLEDGMAANAMMCLALFLSSRGQPLRKAFDTYASGLALMGKSDLLLRFELNAFQAFFGALMEGLKATGAWDGAGDGKEAFETFATPAFKATATRDWYFKAGCAALKHEVPDKPVTLEEVAMMKVLADLFFVQRAREWAGRGLARSGADAAD